MIVTIFLCTFLVLVGFAATCIRISSEVEGIRQGLEEVEKALLLQRELYLYRELFRDDPGIRCIVTNVLMLSTGDVRYIPPDVLKTRVYALKEKASEVNAATTKVV